MKARLSFPGNSILLLALMFAGGFGIAHAQVEVTPYAGWMFAGSLAGTNGRVDVTDDWAYGGMIDIPISPDLIAEIMYTRIDTRATVEQRPDFIEEPLFDLAIQYFHLGAVYQENVAKKITGFGAFTLGATLFSPKNSVYEDETRFSIALATGLKIYATERLGLRLQGRLLVPMFFTGGSLWCGGGGCAASVNGGSSLIQGDLGIGVMVRL